MGGNLTRSPTDSSFHGSRKRLFIFAPIFQFIQPIDACIMEETSNSKSKSAFLRRESVLNQINPWEAMIMKDFFMNVVSLKSEK